MKRTVVVAILLVLAACGDDGSGVSEDAATGDAASTLYITARQGLYRVEMNLAGVR